MLEKVHQTVLEINLDALKHNLNFYKSCLKKGVKLMVMVKAAAYGNRSHEVADLLCRNQVDYLAVAFTEEGIELRKQGIEIPIMVMNPAPDSFDNILKYNLEPEVYSHKQLISLIEFLGEKPINIHLEIDTGMHRLGFEANQIDELIETLKDNRTLNVVSIYSHLAGADEEIHNEFSKTQAEHFLKIASKIESALKINSLRHILNSAGIVRFPDYQMDMVRLGIGLYGFEATQTRQDGLRSISTLKTMVSQVKLIKQGETIGYGRHGIAKRDTQIATIAIGYADGFLRAFGNGKISLLVNGKHAPVIGNICMDMCMLNVTGIEVKEGDEVIVFGEQPSIKQLADAIGTIPYEILTSISKRVPRVFFTEGG